MAEVAEAAYPSVGFEVVKRSKDGHPMHAQRRSRGSLVELDQVASAMGERVKVAE
jgi:hypothetical protein